MYRVFCDGALLYDVDVPSLRIFNTKLELELNKTGSFSFTIYPDHPFYNALRKLRSIITVYQDDNIIFRGRILNEENGFYNEKTVVCEGELAFLLDSIQRPYDFLSGDNHTTVSELFSFYIARHNEQVDVDKKFTVGNVTVVDDNDYIVRSDSTYLNTWDSINKKLIESFGGYLNVRHEDGVNYIDYLADFTRTGTQHVEFGKNLIDIDRKINGEDVATVIVPLGAHIEKNGEQLPERVTIKTVNGGKDYIIDEAAAAVYGKISKTVTWDDVTIPRNLLNKAQKYLKDAINLILTIELTAFDLSGIDADIEAFSLGMYVPVNTEIHGLNDSFLVKKMSIDLLNPQNNKLIIGTTYKTFTEQNISSQTEIKTIVKNVSDVKKDGVKNAIIISEVQQALEQFSGTTISTFADVEAALYDLSDLLSSTGAALQNEIDNRQAIIRADNGDILINQDGDVYRIAIKHDQIAIQKNGNGVITIRNDVLATTIQSVLRQENRHDITLLNSWANYETGTETACYWCDSCGVVHISGVITGGVNTVDTVLFTLPEHYRPRADEIFANVKIKSTGDCVIYSSEQTIISLCGINFRKEEL